MTLSRAVSLSEGESATSWLSRLAKRNGHTLSVFSSHMGVSHRRFAAGVAEEISTMARLAGADAAALTDASLVRNGWSYWLGGERLLRIAAPWSVLKVCPACLLDDEAREGPAGPYGRSAWLLRSIRTCPVHRLSLVKIEDGAGWTETADFALRVARWPGGVADLLARAKRRAASGLDTYLCDRLRRTAAPSWLDGFEMHVAASFCEMLGVTETFGRSPDIKAVTEDEWYRAGGSGFAIAHLGRPGIRDFLEGLRTGYPYAGQGNERPNAVYGTLYKWLTHFARDPSFDPLRDVVAEIVIDTFPVGVNDTVCGKQVEERRVHSIRTASVESGMHRKRLRKLLAVEGIIPADHADKSDGHVLFDARAAKAFLERTSECVPLNGAASYLNAGRVHARLLQESRFIVPVVAGRTLLFKDSGYRKSDLDAFLSKVLSDATEVSMPDGDWCAIPQAARRSRIGAMKIVAAVVDRRLPSRGRERGKDGYLSVLVSLSEVNEVLGGKAKLDRFVTPDG